MRKLHLFEIRIAVIIEIKVIFDSHMSHKRILEREREKIEISPFFMNLTKNLNELKIENYETRNQVIDVYRELLSLSHVSSELKNFDDKEYYQFLILTRMRVDFFIDEALLNQLKWNNSTILVELRMLFEFD